MNFEQRMDKGGPLFWAVVVASGALGYLALVAAMSLPEMVGL